MSDSPTTPDFQAFFESVAGLYLVLDTELRIVAMSNAYCRATRIRREDVLGRKVFDVFPVNSEGTSADAERNRLASFQRVLRTGTSDTMPVQRHDIRRPDVEGGGVEERYWKPLNSPILASDGSVAWILHHVEDVTELIRSHSDALEQYRSNEHLQSEVRDSSRRLMDADVAREQAEYNASELQQSERRERDRAEELAAMLDAVPAPVFIAHDRDCRHITGNRSAEELIRIPRGAEASLDAMEEAKPRHFRAFKDGRELNNSELPAQRAARGIRVRDFEFSIVFDDGTTRELLAYAEPLWNEDGTARGCVHVLIDITKRKLDERLRRDQEAIERSILDSLPAQVALLDCQGEIVRVNHSWHQFANENGVFEVNSVGVGVNYLEVCRKASHGGNSLAASALEGIQSVLRGESSDFSMDYPCHSATRQRWFRLNVSPILSANRGAVVSHWNITEQHLAKASLITEKERLLSILNTAADAIIQIDRAGRIQLVNPMVEKMFGYSTAEMLGQNIKMLMPPPYDAEHDGYLQRYFKTGQPRVIGVGREVLGLRKDGSTFPIDLAVSVTNGSGHFTGVIRDISERKQLQQHVLEIASDEKRRIGQELHDSTMQELTGISLLAGLMLDMLIEEPAHRIGDQDEYRRINQETYSQLCSTATKLYQRLLETNRHIRQLAHGIMPVQIDSEGLRSALEELAAMTREQSHVSCSVSCPATIAIKSTSAATHVYRIVQEAIDNGLRHGNASEIRITVAQEDRQLIVEVHDNGTGYDPTSSPNNHDHGETQGMGLRIMQYRAGILGGTVQVKSRLTGGTTLTCKVPLTGVGDE